MAGRMYQTSEEQANRLFQQKTVAEIKSIEKQTRNDIERKKEELRQMVGERYRELIDAADTIVEMKNSAHKVLSDISHMQSQCSSLHKLHQQHSVAAITSDQDRAKLAGRLSFFSLVSQIKLLVTMPEKLWSVLESQDHLCAARLCLMAKHITDSINQLTASGDLRNAVKSFPILPRQRAAISHFPTLVLQASRVVLQDPSLPLKKVEESLAAVLLIENSSLSEVFQEFLQARMAAVESLFSDEQGLSFKELACRLIQLIRTTLQQVYLMFSSPSSSLSANNHVVDLAMESVSLSDLHLGYWSKFLPAALQDFQPASSTSLDGRLSQDDIHTQCTAFVSKCVSVVPSSLSSALSYVTSIESLVSVRDAVYDMLAKDDGVLNEDPGHATISTSSISTHTGAAIVPSGLPHWDVVCMAVVGRQVILYDELIRNNLQTRMQEIIAAQLSTACSAIHESVLALLADMHVMTSSGSSMTSSSNAVATSTTSGGDMLSTGWLDRNVGAYIWQDSMDDLLPTLSTSSVSTAATQPARPSSVSSMRRSPDGTGAVSVLAMKTRGVTPAAARAYSEFNSSLSSLLSGVRLAVGDTDTGSAAATTPIARWKPTFGEEITKAECVPFKKFACAAELRSFLRMTSFKTTSELLSKFQNRLQQLREEAEDTSSLSSADRARSVDCCLLLARLSSSLFECCPPLEACLLGLEKSSAKDSTTSRSRRSLSTRNTSLSLKSDMRSQPDQEQLNNVRNDINKLTMDAYSVWTSSTVSTMMSSLRHCILSENPRVLLSYAVAWEEIKIEEEGEEGRKVESTIRLPMQICNALGSAMFLLCEEISRVGGHTVSATVQQSLIRMFGDRLLDVFEQLLTGGGDGDGVADAGNTQRSSAIVFSRHLPQPRALQCLFDIKCCATLLAGRGAKAGDSAAYNSRVRAVISWLESWIDPFDLDVFEPYLASNLSRCGQRCSSLYGALYSQAKGSSSNFVGGASALAAAASSGLSTGGKSSSQEQHNVIPMASAINRLPLLPVGTGMTTAAAAQISMDRINTARPPPPKLGVFVAMPELEQRMQLFSLPAAGSNNSNTTQQS